MHRPKHQQKQTIIRLWVVITLITLIVACKGNTSTSTADNEVNNHESTNTEPQLIETELNLPLEYPPTPHNLGE